MKTRRSAVFVIPNYIVGHELVFRHYTNKVVVGDYVHSNQRSLDHQKSLQQKRKNGNN
jgi:hypothetical protein